VPVFGSVKLPLPEILEPLVVPPDVILQVLGDPPGTVLSMEPLLAVPL
jgi:hypothetical protein